MQESTPQGVADGVPRDDAGASRAAVEPGPFSTEERKLPYPFDDARSTPLTIFGSSRDCFGLEIGSECTVRAWTNAAGLEMLIAACQEALGR